MKRIRHLGDALLPAFAAAITLFFAFATPAAVHTTTGTPAQARFDQFIIRFKDSAPEKSSTALRQRLLDGAGHNQGLHVGRLRRLALGADVVRTDRPLDAREAKSFLRGLRADPRVDYAEVDARMVPAFTPNDTHFGEQWHYTDAIAGINLPAAWNTTNGAGQVVAVLDTGAVAHADLAANLVPGYDFISDPASANDGGGRDDDPSDPGDWNAAGECNGRGASNSSWHGTHVAGTIAAVTDNHRGVAGIAFDARVQPLRVLGKCGGASSDIADAIVWASGGRVEGMPANPTPAKVINLSLVGEGACGATTQEAIDAAVANGATVVVAAGNRNDDARRYQPASCNHVITVAALDRTGARARYSNHGDAVDIAAPGGSGRQPVWSTLDDGATVPGGGIHAGYNGTSMAAAHVAGVAALAQARAGNTLAPAQMKSLLQMTSRALPAPCAPGCGAGLLDAAAAVAAAGTPMLFVSDATAAPEGDSGSHAVTFTVSLTQPLDVPVSFDLATANGTATAGNDYVARTAPGQVIPAGQTSKTFAVAVNGDTDGEADERFVVNLANAAGAVVLDAQGEHVIAADDPTALVNGVPITNLSGATDSQRFFYIDVPSGTTYLTVTINGPNGDADLYVRLGELPTEDNWDCLSLSEGSADVCELGSPPAGRYYIGIHGFEAYTGLSLTTTYSTPPPPVPNLSVDDASVVEGHSGTTLMTFTARLSQASASPVTFKAYTDSRTASSFLDFEAFNSCCLTIPAGQLAMTFNVTIKGETLIEADEKFLLTIWGATGAQISSSYSQGTIINDDFPALSVNDVSINEGDSGSKLMTFTVSLSEVAASPVSFRAFTSAGSANSADYLHLDQVFTIPAGSISKTVNVTVLGETTVEPLETLYLNLSGPSGANIADAQGVGYIINNDGALITVNDIAVSEGNAGTKLMTFTVSLSQVAPGPVTYNISSQNANATAGSDYVAINLIGQTIPQGQLSKTHSITIYGDTTIEDTEVVFVNVRQPVGASVWDGQGTGYILNDDGPTLSIPDASTGEGASGTKVMNVTVLLSQAAAAPVTFTLGSANVSATAGSDYVALNSSTVHTIPAGETSKAFQVTVNGDTTLEQNETFTLTLGNATGATLYDRQAIATIYNDDGPTLSINNATVSEGNSGTKLATFTVTLSQAAAVPISYNVATSNVTATAGSDYVATSLVGETIPAGQLSKTFTVTINGDTTVEANETFRATLSNISAGATLIVFNGTGTITNDD